MFQQHLPYLRNALCAVLLLSSLALSAQQTWWVSNRGDQVEVDFTSLGVAINTASAGDTIMLYASENSYGDVTLSKSVHLVGIGYNLDTARQPTLDYFIDFPTTSIGNFQVGDGAQEGSVNSLAINSILVNDGAEDFTFRNTQINGTRVRDAQGIKFIGCYLTGRVTTRRSGNLVLNQGVLAFEDSNAGDILIASSILVASSTGNIAIQLMSGGTSTCLVKNCYLEEGPRATSVSNTLYVNNVVTAMPGGSNSVAYNNIVLSGSNTQNSNGNRYGYTYTETFGEVADRSFDLRYTLAPNSPALGAGLGGVDCGPFGGPIPYQPSGVYGRPLIYQLNMPVEVPAGQDMNVNIKVKVIDDAQN